MNILITGGAGYIGSTIAWKFVDKKHKVTIIDNLVRGSKSNVPKKSNFIKCDIGNIKKLKKIVIDNYDVVIHCAALIDSQESLVKKKLYYENNYIKSKKFFNFCIEKGIKNFIFSSTAAVYGNSNLSVHEKSRTNPLAPYGDSKLKFENFLKRSNKDINYVILRYFNVAGVEKKMRSGFKIKNNRSLFSNLCKSYLNDKIFYVFGKNFNTKDGTAVRDFIYISDLIEIHYLFSLDIMKKKIRSIFNCGYGYGYSVMDIIRELKSLSKKKVDFVFIKKRKNDIAYSVAKTIKLNQIYRTKLKSNRLSLMLKTSILWYKKHSNDNR